MESFNSTDGWYEGRPVASGSTPQNRSSARSSPPTKTSITRTGLSSQIQSSRPLNKALHPIPPQIAQESYRKNHINPRVFTQPGSIATEAVRAGHRPATGLGPKADVISRLRAHGDEPTAIWLVTL